MSEVEPYQSLAKGCAIGFPSLVKEEKLSLLIEGFFAFYDTMRMTPRTIQSLVKHVANRGCISRTVSPHVLKHTIAVTAVQKGISLPVLQRLLGHDRLTTTEIYLNLSPKDVVREFREKW